MDKERIIGKCGNLYMITKSANATLKDLKAYAYVIDKDGKYYTDYTTINTLLKKDEDLIWTPVDEPFDFTLMILVFHMKLDGETIYQPVLGVMIHQ